VNTLITYVTIGERGQAVRSQRRVPGAVLAIGRGTNCQVQLPDSLVALDHARITVDERTAIITAPPGHMRVNGHAIESARLAVGDEIAIGPFAIRVDEPPTGVPLALTVKRIAAAAAETDPLSRLMLPETRLSKRRLSYLAFGAMLLSFLLLPAALDSFENRGHAAGAKGAQEISAPELQTFSNRFLQSWNAGPVSSSHQVFGKRCRTCHEAPFAKVGNQACLDCHTELHRHVDRPASTGARGTKFDQLTCAGCHPDHKGDSTRPRAQQFCATCHANIKQTAADALTDDVTDFARDHPPFRLSLRDADRPKEIRRVLEDSADAVERSNFKFGHKVHLDARGVRAPEGRKVLKCADCHVPNDDGQRMAPISWERQCQACHSLSFDPKRTDRQVPHGSVGLVAATLEEFYARMALGIGPADARQAARERPGTVLTYQDRQRVLSIANAEATRALDELFGKREVCTTCHVVQRIAEAPGWAVAPVRFTQVWMPHAHFSHVAHASTECTSCHAVTESTKAEDIAMTGIERCRECHVGPRPVLGKVTSDCATCHRFHSAAEPWHDAARTQTRMGTAP
jgi:predicted CXXCH cytochrome family protein